MGGSVRTVLVVDDDERILASLRRAFGREWHVTTASSAWVATQLAKRQEFDIAIVDMHLGDASGVVLIRELKAKHPNVRVALVSGYLTTDSTVVALLLQLGGCVSDQPHRVAGVRLAKDLPPGNLFLDCTGEAGRITHHWHPLGGRSGIVTGSFYFSYLRVDSYWLPNAVVAISGNVASDTVRFTAGKKGHRVEMLEYRAPLKMPLAPMNRDVHFALRWTPNYVEVRVGPEAQWFTVPITFEPTRLETSCSTADVVFRGVTITVDPDPEPRPPAPAGS